MRLDEDDARASLHKLRYVARRCSNVIAEHQQFSFWDLLDDVATIMSNILSGAYTTFVTEKKSTIID